MFIDPIVEQQDAPPYREAYPALSIKGVRRAWRNKLQVCEWHNETGELVARMDLRSWSDERLDTWCEWVADGERRGRRDLFDLLHRPSPTGRRLPDALCQGCRRAKPTLYLVAGVWGCAECHGLVQLGSLLTAHEKRLVQARSLHREVGGRTPTRGFRTWDRKRLRLERLAHELQTLGLTQLREHLRAQVRASWPSDLLDMEDDDALTAIGYRPPVTSPPAVAPWFG